MTYVSVNSNWVHLPPPRVTPRGSGFDTKLARGVGIWHLKVARGPGIRQGPGFCGKWKSTLKKVAWINFLQVKTKNKLNFWPFSRFTCFLNGIFAGLWAHFLVLLSHIPYKNSEELPLTCLYLKFSLGYDYPHLLLYKRLWLCEMFFFPRIRFIGDKYRASQNIAKNGEHCIVDFQLKLC